MFYTKIIKSIRLRCAEDVARIGESRSLDFNLDFKRKI